MKNIQVFALVLILVALLAAAPASAQGDADAVRQTMQDFVAAFEGADFDAFMAFYAEDATQLAPGAPARVGAAAIRAAQEEFFNANDVDSEATWLDVKVSGDWAHVRATYSDTAINKESGEASQISGNWLVVLRKQDDGWKVYSELWNQEAPPQ